MISWSEEKNALLRRTRKVCFEDIVTEILADRVLDILPHPKRSNQKIIIVNLHGYACAVPYVTDAEGNIFLKTIYPSRSLQAKYGGHP